MLSLLGLMFLLPQPIRLYDLVLALMPNTPTGSKQSLILERCPSLCTVIKELL